MVRELQATVLASRLMTIILNELELEFNHDFLWGDSSTELKYLKNNNTNFEQYIMDRTNEIRSNSNP